MLSTFWFGFYLMLQQGYFMGFLFMIAGYFTAGSYDRKGFGRFVGERFTRLVIPSLIYMAAITPFIVYVELGRDYFQPQPGAIYRQISERLKRRLFADHVDSLSGW